MQTPKWKMIKSAKVIVMDEAHSYNSFHGSNVYHVIKRMKKYMKDIQFIGSSATLDNAKEFFSEMFDLPIDSIQSINTTKGRKRNMHRFFIMPRKYGQRSTMERLSGMCFRNKRKQLVFSNKHKDAEYLARNVEEDNKNIRIEVHRGGLKQADKRLTEIAMKDGDLDIISCTPTLELGIDIGLVDVAISAFKSEYDAFVQRIGRAGRSGQKSYAICVLDPDDAMCHYYSREGKIENEYIKQKHYTRLNKDNPIISEKHAAATQAEYDAKVNPFTKFNQYNEFALSINLRGTSGELNLKLSHDSSNMGRRDAPAGYYELYQNALYPYNKHPYQVDSITKTKNGAQVFLSPSNEKNKKTEPMVKTTLTEKIMEKQRESESELMSIPIRYGRITILRTIVGYYKGDYGREESEAFKGEDIPSWNNFSWSSTHMAIGVVLPSEFVNSVMITENSQRKDDPGIHTISHIFVNAAKIVTKAEAIEIDAYYEDGIIYLYDNTAEGANGCSQMIYENFEKVLEICRDLLTKCDCDKSKDADWGGCPKCTYTTGFCLTKNKELSKQTAKGFFGVL